MTRFVMRCFVSFLVRQSPRCENRLAFIFYFLNKKYCIVIDCFSGCIRDLFNSLSNLVKIHCLLLQFKLKHIQIEFLSHCSLSILGASLINKKLYNKTLERDKTSALQKIIIKT